MPYLNQPVPDPEPLDCRILTAALDLFMEKGYHNVSVHEIQKRAVVSIGSIYKHFGGKEGIAQALYHHILGEIEQLVDKHVNPDLSARQQCQGIISDLFAHTETHPAIIGYVFHAKHADFLPEHAALCDSPAFVKMRAIIQSGMESGEFRRMDPHVATGLIFGAATRLIQMRLDEAIDQPLNHYLTELMEGLWQGMMNTVA